MSDPITDDQVDDLIATSTEVARYDHKNNENDDDYFAAVLYKTADGNHFRIVEMSGFSSEFDGAGNASPQWVEDAGAWANDWIETYGPSE